jgi:parvulin-like peptidyl-prolyl isomerase
VRWEDLDRMMAEAAGGQVLQEVVLDRMLNRRTAQAGVKITEQDIAAERRALVEAIARSAGAAGGENEAERLLENVRRNRGLGEVRFAHLLERNARLRKLIAPVSVSDEEVRQAFDIRHGPRYRTRVIVAPTDRAAAQIRAELDAAPANLDERSMYFATVAAKKSTDPSAERGGMLEPISPADPAYPAGLRGAVEGMNVGDISPVLAVDKGYAIALLEEKIPAQEVAFAGAAEGIRAEVRVRRERLAMDALARDLLRDAGVRVMNPSLAWGWRASLTGRAAGEPN